MLNRFGAGTEPVIFRLSEILTFLSVNPFYMVQTQRLKLELFSLDFGHRLKTEPFGNGTIMKNADIRTFGFWTSSVNKRVVQYLNLKKLICYSSVVLL